ncbi:antitoxin Xre/MbcA/ParS toxin-binding domain-containing protein [Taklimakanibacter deserti]|uniref:antitoxin Xre/MbcA/ParS toxin-binding domain-containing protein n=1 Tax=Taklimakanibacter deserti TaxID=2267839 RepID=UPI000E6588E1
MNVADSELIVRQFSEGEPPVLSPRRISQFLGIEQSELAALIGIPREALSTKTHAPKLEQALRSLVRILAMAIEMTGEKSRAAIWFKHQPIPGWAGKTAYDLVGAGKVGKVSDYLESVRAGVYA